MAYIESFVVERLAGRPTPVRMSLDRHTNIFWGLNGSGKTSLLRILSSAMSGDASLIANIAFERAEVRFRINDDAPLIVRRFIKNDGDSSVLEGLTDEEALYQEIIERDRRKTTFTFGESLVPDDSRAWVTEILDDNADPNEIERWRRRSFRHTFLPLSRFSAPYGNERERLGYLRRTSAVADFSDEGLAHAFSEQVSARWHDYNNTALFGIRKIQEEAFATILALLFGGAQGNIESTLEKITADEAYELVRDFLRAQKVRFTVPRNSFIQSFDDDPRLQQVVAEVRAVAKKVDATLGPQRKFKAVIDRFYSGGKRLEITGTPGRHGRKGSSLQVMQGDIPLKLSVLSSGEKQLLQLVLEVLAADNATVLIDEPELSMHVDWQQRLVASMQQVNPDCQLVLATHSPEIMADIEDRFIHQL